jgi:hypothetical protein
LSIACGEHLIVGRDALCIWLVEIRCRHFDLAVCDSIAPAEGTTGKSNRSEDPEPKCLQT